MKLNILSTLLIIICMDTIAIDTTGFAKKHPGVCLQNADTFVVDGNYIYVCMDTSKITLKDIWYPVYVSTRQSAFLFYAAGKLPQKLFAVAAICFVADFVASFIHISKEIRSARWHRYKL